MRFVRLALPENTVMNNANFQTMGMAASSNAYVQKCVAVLLKAAKT